MYSVQYYNPLAFNGTRTAVIQASSVINAISKAVKTGIKTEDVVAVIRIGK